jgi:hypothetical protein
MIENFASELIWDTFKLCDYAVAGLRRAGFSGGWLNKGSVPHRDRTL